MTIKVKLAPSWNMASLKENGPAKLQKKNQNYNTLYSHVVPHHSTDRAITGLTAEIRRDPVLFRLYGRSSLADPF